MIDFENMDPRQPTRLMHAIAALRHIARVLIDDPDLASFASAAAWTSGRGLPGAVAPAEDYIFPGCTPGNPCLRPEDCSRCESFPSGSGG